jgi:DNA-binding NarL/FixJ family response regulator
MRTAPCRWDAGGLAFASDMLDVAQVMCCLVTAELRVLIVDDHPGFRRATRRLLTDEGYRVVGEADGVSTGYAAALALRPDIILLDLRLADGSGLDLAKRLALLTDARPRTVLISSRDPAGLSSAALASGAIGFLPKAELTTAGLAALLGDGRED